MEKARFFLRKSRAFLKETAIKLSISFGVIFLSAYLIFRVQFINLTPVLAVFSILLFLAEFHTIFHFYGMFYSLWPRKYETFIKLNRNKELKINIFICVCGEPLEIVRKTIFAAKTTADLYVKKIGPKEKPKIIVLNDGLAAKKEGWFEVAKEAENTGVFHLERERNEGFKAGNINNGINEFKTIDPFNTIDIVFDADFAAKEEFLVEITKPFARKNIDFVQSPQRYQNEDSWVAKAAAAHQIFFFDYICAAKGYDNALFLCGTNFAIRRSALKEVGNMDTRFITEDYATSLNLHLCGKKGVFIPKVLALGMAPSTLKAYFSQQQRWSKGSFDVTLCYLKQIIFGPLTLKQKFHYLLSATYYLIGIRDLFLLIAPFPYLIFGVSLIKMGNPYFLFTIYLPLLFYNFIMFFLLFKSPVKSLILDIISFPVFTFSFLSSVLKRNLQFVVTIKKYEKENPFKVYKVQLVVAILLFFGLFYTFKFNINKGTGAFINSFWAIYDTTFLSLGFFLVSRENYNLSFIDKILKPFSEAFRLYVLSTNPLTNKRYFRPSVIFAFVLIFSIFFTNISNPPVLPYASPKEISKDSKLRLLIPDKGVYYGYYHDSLNEQPKNPKLEGVVPGEKTSLVMFYQDWRKDSGFNKNFMEKISAKNIVPVITWEPWDSRYDPYSKEQEKYSLKKIASGARDDYIRKFAKEAALYKKPVFLRFAHEMNGNWYSWGNVDKNTPSDYKKMWIHVYKIFEKEGAKNVIWVWAPNNHNEKGETKTALDYYPGDKYVDWVGFSGFNWGYTNYFNRWTTFREIAYNIYQELSRLKKPIMVAETSSVGSGSSKSYWYQQTIEKDLPYFKNIKAVIFWDSDFKNADFSISDNKPTKDVIQKTILKNKYFLKQPYQIMV